MDWSPRKNPRWAVGTALGLVGGSVLAWFFFVQIRSNEFTHDGGVHGKPGDGSLPGVGPFSGRLKDRLARRRRALGGGYRPRTRHLDRRGAALYTNRLLLETSPYLLQHAHNPVNWYPWGDDAFERARELGRPVLLSIGYSTCHWCHVMEEESFEDPEIARLMNEKYIAIKVDREERPDVDAVYMGALQAMTGRGGWPMTVWLTADRKPFYGGTYFPARDGDRGASVGFSSLLSRLRHVFDQDPVKVAYAGARLTAHLQQSLAQVGHAAEPTAEILHRAQQFYLRRFDAKYGGLLGAPKFPSSLPIRFLLRYHRRTGDARSLQAATRTLEMMAAGGIRDHVGGGFHRYSTDERWLVPHFEKMLYDNALLSTCYLEASQATGRKDFQAVVRNILRYIAREMTAPGGAFYSATDADSPAPNGKREEGLFFTWTSREIDAALSGADAALVRSHFGVTRGGNYEGRSILHAGPGIVGKRPAQGTETRIARALDQLYSVRSRRPPPLRDEKILTAWNGLMISALARAGFALDDSTYLRGAERAADFVWVHLQRHGRLFRSYHGGQVGRAGFLDDYAFLTAALLDLFEATSEPRWLERALILDRSQADLFEDTSGGGFFMTAARQSGLLVREKPSADGAVPSGNSVAVLNLLRLYELTTDEEFRRRAIRSIRAFPSFAAEPASLSEMLLAVDYHLDRVPDIVLVKPSGGDGGLQALLLRVRSSFLPNRVLLVVAQGAAARALGKAVPFVQGKVARNGRATAYVCERGICDLPTTDPEIFAQQIARVQKLH